MTLFEPCLGSSSLLSSHEWIEFNCITWGLKPLQMSWPSSDDVVPSLHVWLYADRRGRLHQPPLNVYLPVIFRATPTEKVQRVERQWRDLGGQFARALRHYRIRTPLTLPPEVTDVRPFLWHGFHAVPAYTYILPLPHDFNLVSSAARKNANKAARAGYTCRIAQPNEYEAVLHCLHGTENRQHFCYHINVKDLMSAIELLGQQRFRVYICVAPTGAPAAARVVLTAPGERSIDWLAGTRPEHLQSGATQLLIRHVLDDLAAAGSVAFDFAGANLVTVSAAKAEWGGRLAVMYRIFIPSLRTALQLLRNRLRDCYRRLRPRDQCEVEKS